MKIRSLINAGSFAPDISTVRYRSESDVTTIRSLFEAVLVDPWVVDEE